MTIAQADETDFSSADLTTIRVPPTVQQLPRIKVETNSFWKKTSYTINDQ